jgi:histone H3/H4
MASEWIVVKSKIKELTGDMSVSGDFSDVLNAKVKQLVLDAVKRAEANNRKTVMGRDL